MKEECLICGATLRYLEKDKEMECAICHAKIHSKTVCQQGHYVCDACHTSGCDAIMGLCLGETSKNPIAILQKLMALSFCHMHGPEHHILVGSALLTAYKNAGGNIELEKALMEMQARSKKVPGGVCGFWGACGAGISTGIFVALVTGSTPLANEAWGLANRMTSSALGAIGEVGGPRCCKRDSYLAVIQAVEFAQKQLGIEMELSEIQCTHSAQNNQCIGERCPFIPKKKIAFLCVHNSCRSQIAEALGRHFLGRQYDFYSAGSERKPQINQDAVRLIKELYGIDMEQRQYSKLFSEIPKPDILISMGCEVVCPVVGKDFDENWGLPDPTGQDDATFKKVIAEIKKHILSLENRLADK